MIPINYMSLSMAMKAFTTATALMASTCVQKVATTMFELMRASSNGLPSTVAPATTISTVGLATIRSMLVLVTTRFVVELAMMLFKEAGGTMFSREMPVTM